MRKITKNDFSRRQRKVKYFQNKSLCIIKLKSNVLETAWCIMVAFYCNCYKSKKIQPKKSGKVDENPVTVTKIFHRTSK